MGEEDEERIRNGTGQGRRCDVTAASGLRLTTVPLCFFTLPRSLSGLSRGEICECRWGFAQRGHFAIFGNWRFRVDNSILQMKARSSSVIDLYKLNIRYEYL